MVIHLIFAFLMEYLDHSLIVSFCICLFAGILACQLLLFILLPHIWKLLAINVFLALLIALACFGQTADEQQEAADGVEMTGVQAA